MVKLGYKQEYIIQELRRRKIIKIDEISKLYASKDGMRASIETLILLGIVRKVFGTQGIELHYIEGNSYELRGYVE